MRQEIRGPVLPPAPPIWGGTPGEGRVWKEAMDAYYWDALAASYALVQSLGVGFQGRTLATYRLIEGEAITRAEGRFEKIDDHHTLELTAEVEAAREALVPFCRESIEIVSSRLGWDHAKDGWITVLSPEADVPWNGARAGYMMNKYPYDKICLPTTAIHAPERFSCVLRHEYAHIVILNRTLNRAPNWLQEGIAITMQGLEPRASMEPFRNGARWLDPIALNAAFELDRREESHHGQVSAAYDQAHLLVTHLGKLMGDVGFRALLGAFTNNSIWTEVKIALGEPSAEEALHEVYGFGQKELFQQAQSDLR
jgi:hypothetical protein